MAGRIKGQGMNWLEIGRRMAIYARDGHRCAFCNTGGGPHGFGLSVDHLTASHLGGQNTNRNLITCCGRCNSSKQKRSVSEFVNGKLYERGHDPKEVMQRIASLRRRSIDRKEGRRLADARENRVVPPPYRELQAVAKRKEEANKKVEARMIKRRAAQEKAATAERAKRGPTQTGKKGGKFVISASGKKRYVGKAG